MPIQTIVWSGASGETYLYWIYPLHFALKESPGNFILAKKNIFGFWIPCLIGETDNLKKCLRRLIDAAVDDHLGVTHVHAHLSSANSQERQKEEQDLVRLWCPFVHETAHPCDERATHFARGH